MKVKNLLLAALSIMIVLPAFADITEPLCGDSYTAFGDYVLKPSNESVIIGGTELTTYDLEYANLGQVVKIAVDTKKNCRKFIVMHPNFEVEYVCKKNGFGVCRIEKKYASLESEFVNRIMDESQFSKQEIIMTEARPTEELLHAIAGFFPKLIKEDIRQLAAAN